LPHLAILVSIFFKQRNGIKENFFFYKSCWFLELADFPNQHFLSSSVFGFWSWVTSDRLPPRNQKPKKQSFETEFLVSGKKK